jgi:hypothetical protein
MNIEYETGQSYYKRIFDKYFRCGKSKIVIRQQVQNSDLKWEQME